MVPVRRFPHDGHMSGSTNEQAPTSWSPPPPVGTEDPVEEPTTGPVVLQLLAAGIGAVAAAILGSALGGITAMALANDCSPNDGWCGLGAAVGGLMIGLLVAVIAYVVAGVVTIVWRREPGNRAIPIVVHLTIPPAVVLFLLLLGAVAETLS